MFKLAILGSLATTRELLVMLKGDPRSGGYTYVGIAEDSCKTIVINLAAGEDPALQILEHVNYWFISLPSHLLSTYRM